MGEGHSAAASTAASEASSARQPPRSCMGTCWEERRGCGWVWVSERRGGGGGRGAGGRGEVCRPARKAGVQACLHVQLHGEPRRGQRRRRRVGARACRAPPLAAAAAAADGGLAQLALQPVRLAVAGVAEPVAGGRDGERGVRRRRLALLSDGGPSASAGSRGGCSSRLVLAGTGGGQGAGQAIRARTGTHQRQNACPVPAGLARRGHARTRREAMAGR